MIRFIRFRFFIFPLCCNLRLKIGIIGSCNPMLIIRLA